jgi:DNA-binding MarR family transcriptional regulator
MLDGANLELGCAMSTLNSPHSQTFLRFLNLVQAMQKLPDFPKLDPVEERLLHLFGTVWHAEQKITVLQAMAIYDDVSSTTAHRRLKSMRNKGIITLVSDLIDTRIKYVMPTPLASRYFAQLGKCLDDAQLA